jgi:hypothetical protein
VEKAPACSERTASRLIDLFARRVERGTHASPRDAIRNLISHLRRRYRGDGALDDRMTFYLHNRQIVSARIVDDLNCVAALEPIGSQYVHGFNILVTRQDRARLRFSLAHEICHTFFYEYVPEIKFFPHELDPMEERLCDFGASELLMPSTAVRRSAAQYPICIESLRALAEEFVVSTAAMFLKLRSLKLWNCVFSEWHRMLNGNFELARIYGARRLAWQWDDPSILAGAWESFRPSFGNTFVRYEAEPGNQIYSPARFQVQRVGNRIVSLWGSEIRNPVSPAPSIAFH